MKGEILPFHIRNVFPYNVKKGTLHPCWSCNGRKRREHVITGLPYMLRTRVLSLQLLVKTEPSYKFIFEIFQEYIYFLNVPTGK